MASFDFISAASEGYKFTWEERDHILRLAFLPAVIKLASFVIVALFSLETNLLRQGLVLLPSYFAEGFLVAQLIRIAVFKEYWPAKLSGDQKKDAALIQSRSRGILAGTIVYVLIKLVVSCFSGLLLVSEEAVRAQSSTQPMDMQSFLLVIIGLSLMIWAFRLLWLYIPAALDYSVRDFLGRINGYSTSLYMMGTWLLCSVPMALLLIMMSEIFSSLFPAAGETPAIAYVYAMTVAQAVIELLMTIVASVAMAFGIQSIYDDRGHEKLF